LPIVLKLDGVIGIVVTAHQLRSRPVSHFADLFQGLRHGGHPTTEVEHAKRKIVCAQL
jgi:hypothetical protein